MQQLPGSSIIALALAALAACSGGDDPPPFTFGQIEIRPAAGGAVTGSAFECLGDWPSVATPCSYPWASHPVSQPSDQGDGRVRMTLGRSPAPVDGGASSVVLDVQFGFQDSLGVFAYETTTRPGLEPPTETSQLVSGWIEMAVTGKTAAQRNAGRFSLEFAWGSLAGTYDTIDRGAAR